MCKVIAIINKDPANNKKIQDFLMANVSALGREPNGFSVYRDGKTTFFPNKEDYLNLAKHVSYNGEEIFMIHTRTATAGSRDVDGLHLQKIDKRFVFAHNGVVSEYSTVSKFNDSYYFFRNYLVKSGNKVDSSSLQEFINDKNFFGKGFLYDEKLKEFHIFCNSKMQLHLLPECIIFTTWVPEYMGTNWEFFDVLGYKAYKETKGEYIDFLFKEDIDDTYLRFKNGVLDEEIGIKRVYSSAPYSNGVYSGKKKEETEKELEEAEKLAEEDYANLYGNLEKSSVN